MVIEIRVTARAANSRNVNQNQDDFRLEEDEKSPAEAATHSPVVGEKRLRDEDDSEQQHDRNGGGAPGVKSETSPPPGSNGNGAFSGQANGGNPNTAGSGMVGATSAGAGQHDSLYIGDLQWVCTPSTLISSHVCCISETSSICDARHPMPLGCVLPSFHSGRLMRICGKPRRIWGSTLTTRILRSQSIR